MPEEIPAPNNLKLSDLVTRKQRMEFISTHGNAAFEKLVTEDAQQRGEARVTANRDAQRTIYDRIKNRP
jgi:hypothetical protein